MELTHPRSFCIRILGLMLSTTVAASGAALANGQSFIGPLKTITPISTTIPSNGDVNPYGVAQVPVTKGKLVKGRFLISNFNNGANLQGTGTTIVQIAPNGTFGLFAQINPSKVSCPGGVGLTTALVALSSGYVIVGSLPTKNGMSATAKAGCLIVLNWVGGVVETFSGGNINGPWDMTALDAGPLAALFVTNVLNGTVGGNGNNVNRGTVVRMLLFIPSNSAPVLIDSTVIGSGFPQRTDPAALVIGPTGVAYDDSTGILYVADTLTNRIAWIPNALFRMNSANRGGTVFAGGKLNSPLGLALTPNHHLVAANGGDGNLVEINPATKTQVAVKLVDKTPPPPLGAGSLFGLATVSNGVYFVDDVANNFQFLH